MKLMIVEDHVVVRKKICELLARRDVEIRECASGEEAIRTAREFLPDWIIMDVNLPGINGFEATATIRKKVPSARIAIICAEEKNYLREEADAAGAELFLSKHRLVQLPRMLYGDSPSPPVA